MAIKNIIFDFGNVMITNDWHEGNKEKTKAYCEYFNVNNSKMEKAWKVYWPAYKVGKLTEDEFWRLFLTKAGAKHPNVSIAKKLWRKYQKPIENMPQLANKLKKNYKLGALTNIGKEWLDFKIKKFKLDKTFKLIVSSGYAGVAKPNRKIYKIILEKMNAKPNETLFIDDSLLCVVHARLLGINVIQFKGQKDLEKKLREKGIKF